MKKLIITMLVLLISSVAYADQVKIDVGYLGCPVYISEREVREYFSKAGCRQNSFEEALRSHFSRGYDYGAKLNMTLYAEVPTREKGRKITSQILNIKEYPGITPTRYIYQKIFIDFKAKNVSLITVRFVDEHFKTITEMSPYQTVPDPDVFRNIKKIFDRIYIEEKAKQSAKEW